MIPELQTPIKKLFFQVIVKVHPTVIYLVQKINIQGDSEKMKYQK